MSPRGLRLLAIAYLAKMLVVGALCLVYPRLPERAWNRLRRSAAAAAILGDLGSGESGPATR